jgi:glycine dehydrogenase subunit 1
LVCFAGGGCYEHDIPAIVPYLALRSEFATAYTPYQAEVSQGTLQVIYEFQSYICRLTGLDVSNASLYDGATALVEAVLLAVNQTRRKRVLVPQTLGSGWRRVLTTYLQARELELVDVAHSEDGRLNLEELGAKLDEDTACVVLVQPNGLGILEDARSVGAKVDGNGALLIAAVNPTTLALVDSPGSYGASVAVGEGQPLGLPMSFGGPAFGFIAARDELKRRMPGRIVGETVDREGKRGFVLTLQTREQHIRREKATSNICTNQGLAATMATIYMSALGKEGMIAVARACHANAHYLAQGLRKIEGVQLPFDAPFFHEFVLRTPLSAADFLKACAAEGVLAGIALSDLSEGADERDLLVAVTELRTREEMDRYLELAQRIVTGSGATTVGRS